MGVVYPVKNKGEVTKIGGRIFVEDAD